MTDYSYKNVRSIRKEQKISLRTLSEKSGLSISFLSNYENGKVNITISSLHQIAQALGVPIKRLLATEEDATILVVRKEARYGIVQHASDKGRALQEFLTRGKAFDMQVTVMHLPPYMDSGKPCSHESQEFIYILEGNVKLFVFGQPEITLQPGDMAYYDAQHFHSWQNDSEKEAVFLLVANKEGF